MPKRRSIHWSGSGFHGNEINGSRPVTRIKDGRDKTNYVSLSEWCNRNFISRKVGRTLIKKKYLVAQRLFGKYWVCANLDCLEQLLEYLGLEELFFDAQN